MQGALIVIRGRVRWRLCLVISMATVACTTRLYPGPNRRAAEVATLATDGVNIIAVDDLVLKERRPSSFYEVLAGVHAVAVELHDNHPVFAGRAIWRPRTSDTTHAVCIMARGAHVYLLRPVDGRDGWRPEVIDENVTEVIAVQSTSPVAPDCSSRPPTNRNR